MTELVHNQLEQFFQKNPAAQMAGVYLLHGESLLVEQALDPLLTHLLQGASRDLNCEIVEGVPENIPEALERLSTYSLLGGPKVVLFKEAKVFESHQEHQRWIDQIKETYENDNLPKAAKYFLSLCGRLGLDLKSVHDGDKVHPELRALAAELGHNAVTQLTRHCLEQAWTTGGAPSDAAALLKQAIEKGFPAGHHLILTVYNKVPKKLKLYKTFQTHGLIVDCSVPQGQRRADKLAQEAILQQTLENVLQKADKQMAAGLFGSLCEMTGFDLRTFIQNLEKLIDYVGPRTLINAQDVQAVVQRTKRDPIYEITNAVADRNIIQALFYLDALLKSQWHPLQIVAALTNQIRKLLVAKDFIGSAYGRKWRAGMPYGQFQQEVLPDIQLFDAQITQQVGAWEPKEPNAGSGVGTKRPDKATRDLCLAASSKNPYAVFQILLKAEKFGRSELVQAMRLLNQTDLRLKSSGQDAALVLKASTAAICRSKT